MNTFMAKKETVKRNWYIVDASDMILGRMLTTISRVLQGKHKPEYTPHVDVGDFVIITNASKVKLTGKKMQEKVHYYVTGFQSGLRKRMVGKTLETAPEKILNRSVRRMLPRSRLGKDMLRKLKIYAGAEHPHQAQQPKELVIRN
ncbi:MAG: 50S ribosomal protein L13 [Candidatus Brocadia sp. AMX2]|uniref:Large ribosomal subunit protein uL13 n=1 Tax=Candidatus Brocadia sinica JPN1 TaxID=1197129 RepID=A0ABQ0K2X9_9BACT|nr:MULTISPECIES: 50S ribosomal protein L13 [Brocadia]KXK32067.1 MAG: 50S ribosomal protein L13 [Candidatus Brocadia sinica]MBC6933741.1 50S ribosomal protein L13 [Candidatus Brocadia sp.]MBL1170144.1 50S ribosomal protein L13 [Candidatus Brocadia sp. AMX1]NOG43045.1 50S ribosomal protein L13 [Planctomycetota bacterium]KAA0242912.1 MAG: 50S ribosomal protein L13 [Candidatus Brocadia sp. AMX2]